MAQFKTFFFCVGIFLIKILSYFVYYQSSRPRNERGGKEDDPCKTANN